MHGHLGIPRILYALGLSLLAFEPKWHALTKLRPRAIYVTGILVLILGLLGWFVIPRV